MWFKKKYIDKSVHFTGKNYVSIGEKTIVSEGTWFNINKNRVNNAIQIGQYCFIGKRNFFTAGKAILLEDFVSTSVNCNFLGESHQIDDPSKPYWLSDVRNVDTIIVETNVFIGANVTILGNCLIGYGSVIGAGSVISSMNIPPFSLVVGNPARIVKRYSFKRKNWEKQLPEDEMQYSPSKTEYISLLKRNNLPNDLPLMAMSKAYGDLLD
jgi:acetyltransferase-like isoleucine patch superfamily enzyme